ncbi:MAG TPA: HAD-IIIA family hydrolase [Candidatus Saccharimonadales bacterium]|nr:HAD-IIIA family hydrolase [Candidatus Saccharimonadales bacterium]
MKVEGYPNTAHKATKLRHLPDFSASSVFDIDFKRLQKMGVKHALFDLDLTIRKPRAAEIEANIITYLVEQRNNGTLESLSLATNNMKRDIAQFSDPLGAHVFQPFYSKGRLVRKPYKQYFERIITALNAKPQEIVMIGDKAGFDVAGGNRVGMHTILLEPQGKDLIHDRLLLIRARDNWLLKRARTLAAKLT